MCDPVTATLVITAALSAGSAAQQGRETNAAAKYNAREQDNEATRVRNRGVEEENLQRRRTAEFAATQRAQLAASGVQLGTGTAADLIQDTEELGEVDAQRIRTNTEEQAASLERGAINTKSQGRAAKRAGNLQAVTTLVGAAGSAQTGGGQPQTGTLNPKWYNNNSAARRPLSSLGGR